MSENVKLIGMKLEHLARMRAYLDYSTRKMQGPLEKIRGKRLDALTPEEHETIAAFRTRLADFQEHLGKTEPSVPLRGSSRATASSTATQASGWVAKARSLEAKNIGGFPKARQQFVIQRRRFLDHHAAV